MNHHQLFRRGCPPGIAPLSDWYVLYQERQHLHEHQKQKYSCHSNPEARREHDYYECWSTAKILSNVTHPLHPGSWCEVQSKSRWSRRFIRCPRVSPWNLVVHYASCQDSLLSIWRGWLCQPLSEHQYMLVQFQKPQDRFPYLDEVLGVVQLQWMKTYDDPQFLFRIGVLRQIYHRSTTCWVAFWVMNNHALDGMQTLKNTIHHKNVVLLPGVNGCSFWNFFSARLVGVSVLNSEPLDGQQKSWYQKN